MVVIQVLFMFHISQSQFQSGSLLFCAMLRFFPKVQCYMLKSLEIIFLISHLVHKNVIFLICIFFYLVLHTAEVQELQNHIFFSLVFFHNY